jgi:hypothetical protein
MAAPQLSLQEVPEGALPYCIALHAVSVREAVRTVELRKVFAPLEPLSQDWEWGWGEGRFAHNGYTYNLMQWRQHNAIPVTTVPAHGA